MPESVITTSCAACNKEGPRDRFVWMAHLDFCASCMRSFVRQGLAVRREGYQYACTPAGVRRFPGLEVVSNCPRDGMPIYRRWIDGGIATGIACPYCLNKQDEMINCRGLA